MTNVNKFLSINDKNLLTLFFPGVSIQVTEDELQAESPVCKTKSHTL